MIILRHETKSDVIGNFVPDRKFQTLGDYLRYERKLLVKDHFNNLTQYNKNLKRACIDRSDTV